MFIGKLISKSSVYQQSGVDCSLICYMQGCKRIKLFANESNCLQTNINLERLMSTRLIIFIIILTIYYIIIVTKLVLKKLVKKLMLDSIKQNLRKNSFIKRVQFRARPVYLFSRARLNSFTTLNYMSTTFKSLFIYCSQQTCQYLLVFLVLQAF